MREILFRGKRCDTGEWLEGVIVVWDEEYYIAPAIINRYISMGGRGKGRRRLFGDYYHVDPSTVGQYTGLTDKNGKRIFEGDILAVEQISDSIEHFESPVKCPYNVVVKWDKCSWMWETIGTARKRYLHFSEARLFRKCEVIGNIYDNPELLEVRE